MSKRLFLILLLLPTTLWAEEKPQLWGYGVKSCWDYRVVFNGAELGQEASILEYMHYQDWLAGFVSGLSLATGKDVLRGVDIDGAMRRLQVHCDEKPDDDFFTATRSLVRLLSELE